jgi:hypothetical protein
VIKTGDYKLIPIESSIVGLACSITWFFFGVLDDYNFKITIPNFLGKIKLIIIL